MDCSLPGSSVHGDSLGKNTGVGCQFLLQGIFPIQELNPSLLHCRPDSLPTELWGKPTTRYRPWVNHNSKRHMRGRMYCCCCIVSVVSDSVRPQRQQPTRLRCPWDSPGENTGVGFHFLLQCMKVKVKSLSRARLLVTPWTVAHQAPQSMGFSRQEYWSGVPLPSPEKCTPMVNSCWCMTEIKPIL